MAGPELVATALMLQTGLGSQTSVSLTRIVTGSSFLFGGRSTFGDATTEEMTGGTSTTVTDVGQFELLPDASVAVHVTDVVPNPNVEPDGGRQLAVTAGQLSNTVGCRFAAAPLALVQRIVWRRARDSWRIVSLRREKFLKNRTNISSPGARRS